MFQPFWKSINFSFKIYKKGLKATVKPNIIFRKKQESLLFYNYLLFQNY